MKNKLNVLTRKVTSTPMLWWNFLIAGTYAQQMEITLLLQVTDPIKVNTSMLTMNKQINGHFYKSKYINVNYGM